MVLVAANGDGDISDKLISQSKNNLMNNLSRRDNHS